MTLSLSEDSFKSLPCLKPDAIIKLVGIHLHGNLSSSPFTIQTAEGHFRVPRVLAPLVKRAFQSVEHYDGPGEGAVNEVLKMVAEYKVEGDELSAFVNSIVDEALVELRSRVVEAARSRSRDRSVLVDEAVKVLASG